MKLLGFNITRTRKAMPPVPVDQNRGGWYRIEFMLHALRAEDSRSTARPVGARAHGYSFDGGSGDCFRYDNAVMIAAAPAILLSAIGFAWSEGSATAAVTPVAVPPIVADTNPCNQAVQCILLPPFSASEPPGPW